MKKHPGPMPESVKNFWRVVVKGDVMAEGENLIDTWEELLEKNSDYLEVYKLTKDDKHEMQTLIAEYRKMREIGEAEREKYLRAAEEAEQEISNHYADKLRKILMSKLNPFLPKTTVKPNRRGN